MTTDTYTTPLWCQLCTDDEVLTCAEFCPRQPVSSC